MTPEQTLNAEKSFSTEMASRYLSDAELREFLSGRFSTKFRVWRNREFVTYTVQGGRVSKLCEYRCVDIQLSFEHGLDVFLERADGKELCINHAPISLAENVFLWVPKYVTIERSQMADGSGSTSGLLSLRLQHNPNRLVEGATYFNDKASFDGLLNSK